MQALSLSNVLFHKIRTVEQSVRTEDAFLFFSSMTFHEKNKRDLYLIHIKIKETTVLYK